MSDDSLRWPPDKYKNAKACTGATSSSSAPLNHGVVCSGTTEEIFLDGRSVEIVSYGEIRFRAELPRFVARHVPGVFPDQPPMQRTKLTMQVAYRGSDSFADALSIVMSVRLPAAARSRACVMHTTLRGAFQRSLARLCK